MGVSESQGPSYGPSKHRALIVRTPTNGTPNSQMQPCVLHGGFRGEVP